MLYTEHPTPSDFATNITTIAGGTAIASSATANAYGSWTQVSAGLSFTGYYVIFSVLGLNYSSANIRQSYFDIGIGPNSTSVTTLVPYLCGSNNGGYGGGNNNTGHSTYAFPLIVPRNTPIWVRHQCSTGSTSVAVGITVLAGTNQPGMIPRVSRYEVIGTPTTASTAGVTITPGTSAMGAWTQLTASSTSQYNGLMVSGLFCGDTTQSNTCYTCELGVGASGSEISMYPGILHLTGNNGNEGQWRTTQGVFTAPIAAGSRIAARASCNATPDGTMSVLALGMIA